VAASARNRVASAGSKSGVLARAAHMVAPAALALPTSMCGKSGKRASRALPYGITGAVGASGVTMSENLCRA
jgi:hypothetical protein